MKLILDWAPYKDAGMCDAYADIPKTGGDYAKAIAVCIGSRKCEQTGRGVMCPSFRVSGKAELSTGRRVKLLKSALNGEFGKAPLQNPELAEAMDLCVNCKGCKRECENKADMALIKAEFLAQRFSVTGIPLRNRLFAALPKLLTRLPGFGRLIRWRNRYPLPAKAADSLLGISAGVQLPEPAEQPFTASTLSSTARSGRDLEAGRCIVGLEPSCILSLRDEPLSLDLGEPAKQLTSKTLLFEEFIANGFSCRQQILNGGYRKPKYIAEVLYSAIDLRQLG